MRLLLAVPLLLAGACSTGPSSPPSEHAAKEQSPIINGTPDTTHQAVVALLLGQNDSVEGSCSGTIVKIDPARKIGWVATAAHCVKPGVLHVVQADDFGAGAGVLYSVIDATVDPRYGSTGGGHDFGIVRIGGVDASTPVLPLTDTPDGLTVGMTVTSVGYGMTKDGDYGNSRRYSITKDVAELDDLLIGYDQTTGGICHGDSGGPVIAGDGASARVVGIHSFGTGFTCEGKAFSSRVTDGLDFFQEQIAKALPPASCSLCQKLARWGTGACAALTTKCYQDDNCSGYQHCVEYEKKDPKDCATQFPLVDGLLAAGNGCGCGACADLCANEPACADVGKCGAKLHAEADCTSCIESSCCQETLDCTSDTRCYVCLTDDDKFASCKTNAGRTKLAACAQDKCASACGTSVATIGTPDAPADAGDAAPPPPAAAESTCACRVPAGSGRSTSTGVALGVAACAVTFARRRRVSSDPAARRSGRT